MYVIITERIQIMTKAKLEEYIGQKVTVTLFDGSIYFGKLRKTGTDALKDVNYTLFLTKNRYFIEHDYHISPCFRVSHITKLKKEGEK